MGTEHRNIGRMKHFLHPLLLPLLLLLPSTAYGHKCPQDPSYSCGDDQTCCLLPQAQGVGCCPYREATCCEDKTHCCPHGLTCDTKAGRCIGSQYQLLLTSILYSEPRLKTNQISRRSSHSSSLPSLDSSSSSSISSSSSSSSSSSLSSLPSSSTSSSRSTTPSSRWRHLPFLFNRYRERIHCPDPDFSCDDTQTCCELNTGGYGCCPLGSDAVCCPDKEHCCPHGTVCDVAGGSCSPEL